MKLGLFFTLDMSVERWAALGLLDREKRIYEELLARQAVDAIYWFTYGTRDKSYENVLPSGIVVVPMPRFFIGRLGRLLYSLLAPLLLGKSLRHIDVLKTNQMRGSWTAVMASHLYRKPLIIRTGFTWSLFAAKRGKLLSLDRLATLFERAAYRSADTAVVSSAADADYIRARYRIPSNKIRVIGNYVDTAVFKPDPAALKHKDRFVFVGRLVSQKNLHNLIRAMAGLPYALDIHHHENTLKNELQSLAAALGTQVSFKGPIQNSQLSAVLNQYSLFILPSLYEGMPKTLLEAMACGLAVLGTNIEGIREVIQHGVNGFLVQGTEPTSLKMGITELANDRNLQRKLGLAARETIQKRFSLDSAVENEVSVYERIQ